MDRHVLTSISSWKMRKLMDWFLYVIVASVMKELDDKLRDADQKLISRALKSFDSYQCIWNCQENQYIFQYQLVTFSYYTMAPVSFFFHSALVEESKYLIICILT